jgi:hypothetical protein
MHPRRLTLLLLAVTALGGCATRLPFDDVSSDGMGVDASLEGDAGETASALVDAGTATRSSRDAAVPGDPGSLSDSGAARDTAPGLMSSQSPGDAALPIRTPREVVPPAVVTDAGALPPPIAADVPPDPASFTCSNLGSSIDFCDDFEKPRLQDRWSEVLVSPEPPVAGGTINTDTVADTARAGRGSMLAVLHADVEACGDCLSALGALHYEDFTGANRVSVDFDLRIEEIARTAGQRAMAFQILLGTDETGVTQYQLQLESRNGKVVAVYVEYDTDAQAPFSLGTAAWVAYESDIEVGLALNEWVHVSYVLDNVGSDGLVQRASLTLDDEVLFDGAADARPRSAHPIIELGLRSIGTSDGTGQVASESWRLRYDSFLVGIEPS